MARFQSVNRLEIGGPLDLEPTIVVERARGDCCGCCGGACLRGSRTSDGRFWAGLFLLVAALVSSVLLLLLVWGMQFDEVSVAESASGELNGILES